MTRQLLSKFLLGLTIAMLCAGRVAAEQSDCALALAFGLDVSVSVDEHEYMLQRAGLAAALADPAVAELVVAQPGAVAMIAYEWSSKRHQSVIVPWHMIENQADLTRFAAALTEDMGYPHFYPTAVGQAIAFGLLALDEKSQCARRVLDISGDGTNNDGFPPKSAYNHFPVAGVTVNGLVILGAENDVLPYYETHVIYGTGAFVETAGSFMDYEQAMKRKLLREITGPYLAQK